MNSFTFLLVLIAAVATNVVVPIHAAERGLKKGQKAPKGAFVVPTAAPIVPTTAPAPDIPTIEGGAFSDYPSVAPSQVVVAPTDAPVRGKNGKKTGGKKPKIPSPVFTPVEEASDFPSIVPSSLETIPPLKTGKKAKGKL